MQGKKGKEVGASHGVNYISNRVGRWLAAAEEINGYMILKTLIMKKNN